MIIGSLTVAAIVSAETGVALAMADHALAFAAAPVRAAQSHVLRYRRGKRDRGRVSVVVVQRHEPMARFQVVRDFFFDYRLESKWTGKIYSRKTMVDIRIVTRHVR